MFTSRVFRLQLISFKCFIRGRFDLLCDIGLITAFSKTHLPYFLKKIGEQFMFWMNKFNTRIILKLNSRSRTSRYGIYYDLQHPLFRDLLSLDQLFQSKTPFTVSVLFKYDIYTLHLCRSVCKVGWNSCSSFHFIFSICQNGDTIKCAK